MKRFLRRRRPPAGRMLLIESGPREDSLRLIPRLRESVCGDAPVDLFTCLPGEPEGLGAHARVWRSYEVKGTSERWNLLREIRRERHQAAMVLCSDSPLLAVWKIVLAALLPARILIVDSGRDWFWLRWGNWRKAARLGVSRSGAGNPEFLRRLAHLAFLPFGLCVLLGFAAKVHFLRLLRATGASRRADA